MIIYPALDLMDGCCGRLAQGRLGDASSYLLDPAEAVLGFEEAGADWAHVVDLDGARDGAPRQHGLICDIALSVSVALQVAGGFREVEHFNRAFDAGADRVVVGSLPLTDPDKVLALLDRFGPERIAIAVDIEMAGKTPKVAAAGSPRKSLWDLANLYPQARHMIVTDIGRDGSGSGPNVELYAEAVRRLPSLCIQASGGVGSLDDLRKLKAAGVSGAIVGKALWEQRIDLRRAIETAA